MLGVTEGSGRFLSREGSNVWVKTPEGRIGLPVDPDLPLARRIGDRFFPASRSDAARRATGCAGGSEGARCSRSGWSSIRPVRRSSASRPGRSGCAASRARELARRMAGARRGQPRCARSPSPSAAPRDARSRCGSTTDVAEVDASGASTCGRPLEMPEMLFTVSTVEGPQGEIGVRLPGARLGPRRRPLPERRVRDGARRSDLRRDPAALLHGDRHRPGRDGVTAVRRPSTAVDVCRLAPARISGR